MNCWMTVGLLGWILWFTQQEVQPSGPTRLSLLGWFEAQAACETFGQGLIAELGRVSPEKGYTRGTGWMSMVDTRQDGKGLYTTMYCIFDDIDPRLPDKK